MYQEEKIARLTRPLNLGLTSLRRPRRRAVCFCYLKDKYNNFEETPTLVVRLAETIALDRSHQEY